MSGFAVVPTGAALSAELRGIDLRQALGGVEEDLRQALWQHSVLLFRGQQLSKGDQVRFSRCFGAPVPHPTNVRDRDPEVPEICIIANGETEGKPLGALGNDEVDFHIDLVFLPTPGSVSALYCVETPAVGGDTYWAGGFAAYEALDEGIKRRLVGLEGVYVHRRPEYNPPVPARHPLVCVHPESRRRTLFISPSSLRSIEGVPGVEGGDLAAVLYSHMTQKRFVWRHCWQPGDLVVWDNRCTMHRRDGFDVKARRYMRRTQLLGAPSLSPASG